MAKRIRSEMTLTLRVVSETFEEDETPSLPPMPVVDVDGIDVTARPRPLAKCGAVPARNKRSVGR